MLTVGDDDVDDDVNAVFRVTLLGLPKLRCGLTVRRHSLGVLGSNDPGSVKHDEDLLRLLTEGGGGEGGDGGAGLLGDRTLGDRQSSSRSLRSLVYSLDSSGASFVTASFPRGKQDLSMMSV